MNSLTLSPSRFDRLTLFCFVWAVANVLHVLSFTDRVSSHHFFSFALLLAAALVLWRPHVIGFFLLMLGCSMANTFDWMPMAPNHITFEFIINTGMFLALSWTLARGYAQRGEAAAWSTPEARAALFQAFAPFVRLSLLVLYFYAVLHKLNWDYFNVNISCSTFLLSGYSGRLPFLPQSLGAQWLAVWGTLVVEAAIPLFLCFRRTRFLGIILGCGFHYFLAIHPHVGLYSFSAMLFGIYTLFFPPQFPEQVRALASGWSKNVPLLVGRLQVVAAGGVIAAALIAWFSASHANYINYWFTLVGLWVWLLYGLLYMMVYGLIISRSHLAPEQSALQFGIRPAAFWLIPLLVLFNGMSPYLGLKTQTSFSMFSNLRTEGGISNHLLLPATLQLTSLEHDLVDISDTNLETLKPFVADHQLITFFEFQRIVSAADTDFYARYVRNQHPYTLRVTQGVSNQPELLVPHNWLLAKLVRFRPIDKGPCLCKH
ncbi:hypothetical protein [Hymenobacter tenuis]